MYPGHWAQQKPDAPAVIHSVTDERLSWRELDDAPFLLASDFDRSASFRRPDDSYAVTCARSTSMSGSIPSAWIERPFGVKYSAVVNFTARSSDNGRIVCTEPLPKLRVPIITARS